MPEVLKLLIPDLSDSASPGQRSRAFPTAPTTLERSQGQFIWREQCDALVDQDVSLQLRL